MINLSDYAYLSKLRKTNPRQKLFFTVMTLAVCLWANSPIISVAVLFIMGGITVFRGGIAFSIFAKALLTPLLFVMISVLPIALDKAENSDLFWIFVPIFDTNIGLTRQGLVHAAELTLKIMGAISCLYYLSFNTPVLDILAALRKLRVPSLLIELLSLVYRFIFLIMETSASISVAQRARLGYASLASSYRSLGALLAMVFFRAYRRLDQLYIALESRGYDGELNVLEESYTHDPRGLFVPIVINALLIIAALVLNRDFGGSL